MNTEELKAIWYKLGKKNPWIRNAYDPEFTVSGMFEKKSVQELYEHFQHGNWCLGDCVFFKNICFINQVDGGSEYLVIRDGIDFESISADWFSLEKLTQFVQSVENATDDQLKNLTYGGISPAL